MIIGSWINIKNKIFENGFKIFIVCLIITTLAAGTNIVKEITSNESILKIIPFIYAILFMFAVKTSLNLYEKKFRVRKTFFINPLLVINYILAFVVWAFAVSGAYIFFRFGETKLYTIVALIYLTILIVKILPMFFYVLDEDKRYNPIKAFVKSILDTNRNTIKILFFLIMNLLLIVPVYMMKDILSDMVYNYIGEVQNFIIAKSFIIGFLDSLIFVFAAINLSYLYKTISIKK